MRTAALLAVLSAAPARDERPIVLHAERIHTMDGAPIDGGSVLVQGGRVVAVGPSVPVPSGAIEIRGAHLTPGLIDASCLAGLRGTGVEETAEITPERSVVDDIDPASIEFERLARRGVTTAFVAPGHRSVIGGLAAVMKTAPSGGPRILVPEAALKMALGTEPSQGNGSPRGFQVPRSPFTRRPNTRPAVVAEIRHAFFRVERARTRREELSAGDARLAAALEGRLPVRVYARPLVDLRGALRIAREFGLRIQVEGAVEAHRFLPELKAAGVPVVLGPIPVDPFGTRHELAGEEPSLRHLAAVAAAGIPVALGSDRAPADDGIVTQMRAAIRFGAAPDVALRAVTRGAAEILGVADRVGSIAPGRDADLVLWSADPSEMVAAPLAVVVDGRLVHRRETP